MNFMCIYYKAKYRQVSFHITVTSLTNVVQIIILQIEHKIPFKTLHFLGFKGLTSLHILHNGLCYW